MLSTQIPSINQNARNKHHVMIHEVPLPNQSQAIQATGKVAKKLEQHHI